MFYYKASQKEFHLLEPGIAHDIARYRVQLIRQYHDNDAFGYRFERQGSSIVYSTDCES